MNRVSRRTLMLAVALAAVIAAVLIVTLSGGHSHKHDRAVSAASGKNATQAAAAYLGLGTSALRKRLRNGETLEQIAEATPGHSARGLLHTVTAARAAELRAQGRSPAEIRANVSRLRARLLLQLRRQRRSGAIVASAAGYLGISEAALRTQLRSGKTLIEVAAAHGHSRKELIRGLVRARRGTLDEARRQGQINAAEEKSALRLLRRKVIRAAEAENL